MTALTVREEADIEGEWVSGDGGPFGFDFDYGKVDLF